MNSAHKQTPETELWSLMRDLPQASVIEGRQAKAWFDYTIGNYPDRAEWLVRRCAGIGGSEAGTVLAWYTGDIKSRKTISSLVRDKLLMRLPEHGTPDMLRGQILEEHIRKTFETRLTADGRQWKRRADLERKINSVVPEAYPWMRANVDGVYEIEGNIVIVDFKAPSEASLKTQMRTEGNDEYKAQLNHYAIVADAAGVSVGAMWLVLYDYNKVATDGVQVIDVLPDLTMQQQLVEASDELWNSWILKGKIPETQIRRQAMLPEDIPAWVMETATQAARAKLAEEAATRIYETSRKEVSDWIMSRGKLGDLPLYVGSLVSGEPGALRATSKNVINTELAIERLEELGYDDLRIDELRKPGNYKDKGQISRKYDELREMVAGLIGNLSEGVMPDEKNMQSILKAIKKPPAREESGFDEDALRTALVACEENPHDYEDEIISVIFDRRARDDVAEASAEAEQVMEKFAKTAPITYSDEVEVNDFMKGVPESSF